MAYTGRPIGAINGIMVMRLTHEEEAAAGRVLYAVDGYTHWNPAANLLTMAHELEQKAKLLRAAHSLTEMPGA